jgi:hypothetical protein
MDVHKKMLAVVVSEVEMESESQLERRRFGSHPEPLRSLAAWLLEQEAEEVGMESTAPYWKPVWGALERYGKPIREKQAGARRGSRERCTWRRRSPIADDGDVSGISPMPNAW